MPVRTIQYATPITFGAGALDRLAEVTQGVGATRVLLLGDRGVERVGIIGHIVERLAGLQQAMILDVPPHASEATVQAAAAVFAAEGCDGIVAGGGGSVIDAAKAIALSVSSPGPLARFAAGRETAYYPRSLPPLIAVPTTAGTGSEISRGLAVTTATERLVLLSARLFPSAAVRDPLLTLSLPVALTAATAIVIEDAGGKLLGGVKHPLGEADFSSYLLQAQSSGAKVIGIASAFDMMKQLAEFGMNDNPKQKIAMLITTIGEVHGAGLETTRDCC